MAKLTKTIKKVSLWISGLTTAVITGLLVEYTKEYPIPGTIWNAICWLWDKFIGLMTVNIELWLVFTVVAIIQIFRHIIKTNTASKGEKPQPPRFLSYKREIVDNIPWEWSWSRTYNGWSISDLHPCCPKDDARLNLFSNDCPICKANYWGIVDQDKAAALIENKLKKEFPNGQ